MFAIKGRGGDGVPYTAPPKKQKIVIRGKAIGTCWQYAIGVDAGKQIIMDDLHVQTSGSKYCHFPKRDDYGSAYFTGLLSERLVYKQDRKQPWQWEKIPGHERNEALDCRNYAQAAFKALSPDLDAIDRRLKIANGENVPQENRIAERPRPPKKRGSTLSKFYDDW